MPKTSQTQLLTKQKSLLGAKNLKILHRDAPCLQRQRLNSSLRRWVHLPKLAEVLRPSHIQIIWIQGHLSRQASTSRLSQARKHSMSASKVHRASRKIIRVSKTGIPSKLHLNSSLLSWSKRLPRRSEPLQETRRITVCAQISILTWIAWSRQIKRMPDSWSHRSNSRHQDLPIFHRLIWAQPRIVQRCKSQTSKRFRRDLQAVSLLVKI